VDREPERPGDVGRDEVQSHPGQQRRTAFGPEVGRGQPLRLIVVEVGFRGDVTQLERRVVVPGQLVVDDAYRSRALLDEVLGQQVVVARHRSRRLAGERRPQARHGVVVVVVTVGQRQVVAPAQGQQFRPLGEDLEVVAEPGAGVQPAAGRGDRFGPARIADVGGAERAAGNELEHQRRHVGQHLDDGGARARPRRGERVGDLLLRRDAEARRRHGRLEHPEHVLVGTGGDPVDVVAQPARQRCPRDSAAGPGRDPAQQVVHCRHCLHRAPSAENVPPGG